MSIYLQCPKCSNTDWADFRASIYIGCSFDDDGNLEIIDLECPSIEQICETEDFQCIADDCEHTGPPSEFIRYREAATCA